MKSPKMKEIKLKSILFILEVGKSEETDRREHLELEKGEDGNYYIMGGSEIIYHKNKMVNSLGPELAEEEEFDMLFRVPRDCERVIFDENERNPLDYIDDDEYNRREKITWEDGDRKVGFNIIRDTERENYGGSFGYIEADSYEDILKASKDVGIEVYNVNDL